MHHGLSRNSLACILPAGLVFAAVAQLCTMRFALDAVYPAKTAVVFAIGAAVVLFGLARHHPFAHFGAANQVTLVRGGLVALLAGLIGERSDTGAGALVVGIATAVAVLDGLDGWLARRTGMTSGFGARFDMETDAAFIMVLSVLAWQFGKAGVWVLACGALRYAFVAASVIWPWLGQPLPPSQRRKTVAVLQMVALIVVIAPPIPLVVSAPVAALGLAVLSLSFAVDTVWLYQDGLHARASVSPQ